VRQTPLCTPTVLDAGTVVSGCTVMRQEPGGSEPYLVRFEAGGHEYTCPLYAFQPRTEMVSTETADVPLAHV
jgi:hypothetical protein